MSHVFPRHCHSTPLTAIAGDGCFLIDQSGKRYFDGSGGAAVSCLGHSNDRVTQAIKDQVGQLAFAHTGFFTSDPAEQLADLLIANAPGDLDRVYFVSGGSEAVESAIKLARQYFTERGEPQRRHLIARRQSYHGNTIGALSAGGNAWRRQQFAPLLIDVSHIAPCYEYAERAEGESLQDYGQRVAQELEDEILRLGADSVMAFLAEPVVGATLGAVPAVEGYYKRIREICDKYGVLLILDEVMCGMGRTGHLFACDFEGVAPDILCIAKGLGAGYQPIGAMLCSKAIYDTISAGTGSSSTGTLIWAIRWRLLRGWPWCRNCWRMICPRRCRHGGAIWSNSCARALPRTRMWATSAGGGCFRASNSSPTGTARRRLTRNWAWRASSRKRPLPMV